MRYQVQPSAILPDRWVVVDTWRNCTAGTTARRRIWPGMDEAQKIADRLETAHERQQRKGPPRRQRRRLMTASWASPATTWWDGPSRSVTFTASEDIEVYIALHGYADQLRANIDHDRYAAARYGDRYPEAAPRAIREALRLRHTENALAALDRRS